MDAVENAIRQEAKALKIRNWHNKGLEALEKEIAEAKSADVDTSGPDTPDVVETPPKKEPPVVKTEGAKKRALKKEGRVAKEEPLYPFVDPKGNRIGLYRRTNHVLNIPPNQKDSSYEFVRWSDSK